MRLPLPKEHGAWVMTTLALVAGWNAGAAPAGLAAALVVGAVALSLLAQAAWLDPKASRWIWRLEAVFALLLALAAGLASGGSYWVWAGIAGGLGGLAQVARSGERKGARVRLAAYGAHLAGAAALASCAGMVMAARGASLPDIAWVGAVLSLSFGSGVAFVQAVMPGASRSAWPLVFLSLVAAAFVGICQTWDIAPMPHLALLPVFLRGGAVPLLRRRGIGWKTAGWMETVAGIWTVGWTIGALG